MTRNRRDLVDALRALNPCPEPSTADRLDEKALTTRERIAALSLALDARPVRRRPILRALAPLGVGITLGALTTALIAGRSDARPSADRASLSRISTRGEAVPVTPATQRLLNDSKSAPGGSPRYSGRVELMAVRGPTAFFRIGLTTGEDCYGTGKTPEDETHYAVGSITCWSVDPRFPIHDLSVIQAAGIGGFQVLNIQGFATDGIKTVAVTNLEGDAVAEAAVADNVYKITAYPPAEVSALLALDEGGHVIYRWSFRPQ